MDDACRPHLVCGVAMEFSFIQVLRRSLDGLRKYRLLDNVLLPSFSLLRSNRIFLHTKVLSRGILSERIVHWSVRSQLQNLQCTHQKKLCVLQSGRAILA